MSNPKENIVDDLQRRADNAEAALINLAALAPYADPLRLPPYPEHRRHRLLALLWKDFRHHRIPTQRRWDD